MTFLGARQSPFQVQSHLMLTTACAVGIIPLCRWRNRSDLCKSTQWVDRRSRIQSWLQRWCLAQTLRGGLRSTIKNSKHSSNPASQSGSWSLETKSRLQRQNSQALCEVPGGVGESPGALWWTFTFWRWVITSGAWDRTLRLLSFSWPH